MSESGDWSGMRKRCRNRIHVHAVGYGPGAVQRHGHPLRGCREMAGGNRRSAKQSSAFSGKSPSRTPHAGFQVPVHLCIPPLLFSARRGSVALSAGDGNCIKRMVQRVDNVSAEITELGIFSCKYGTYPLTPQIMNYPYSSLNVCIANLLI